KRCLPALLSLPAAASGPWTRRGQADATTTCLRGEWGVLTMLTIFGQKDRFCDGISRRSFLKIGALGIGAGSLTLADVLRAEASSGSSSRHKAVINIFLGGGPPHQDMWDIKTEAPKEIRGEFKPIATK